MIARSWICELLPYGADRCDSAQNVVRDLEALNLSPWGVVVALVFGMSLIGLVVSVPVSVGSAASRWATARYAGADGRGSDRLGGSRFRWPTACQRRPRRHAEHPRRGRATGRRCRRTCVWVAACPAVPPAERDDTSRRHGKRISLMAAPGRDARVVGMKEFTVWPLPRR